MRISLFLFFIAVQFSAFAASDEVMSWEEAKQKHLLLAAALPRYPQGAEARLFRRRYTCLFELKFDYESGHLREVHVVKSCGDRSLDAQAIGAMKVWQAKPRSIHNLLVPITFKPFGL